jgi:hypothetical protein
MSLINTRLLELRSQSPNLDQWMLRPSMYGAFDCFLAGNADANSIISPELLDQAASAVGRDVKVPVYDAESVSIGSTRSVTIADSENTSQLYTVSFTTYAWGFTIIPSLFMNNEMGMQRDFNRKFLKYLYKFAETLDTACLTALNTAKTQVFTDSLIYTPAANVLIADSSYEERIIGDLTPIMNANDYYGAPFRVVGNPGIQSLMMRLAEKGLYNETNKQIQWLDKTFHFTNRLTNGEGHGASGYIVNPGAVGLVFRHEREAILGTTMSDGTEWGRATLPMLGIPIDTYFYESKGDFNAIAGAASADMTRARKEHYGFAIEVATITAYNTAAATYASPVMKFAIENAV